MAPALSLRGEARVCNMYPNMEVLSQVQLNLKWILEPALTKKGASEPQVVSQAPLLKNWTWSHSSNWAKLHRDKLF